MSEWGARFRAASGGAADDTVDTVDTVAERQRNAPIRAKSVNSVKSVTIGREESQAVGDAERAERASIEAEPALPAPGTPQRTWLDRAHKAERDGLLQAARKRPPSWPDATALPSLGCLCSACRGQRWWRERTDPRGWRCWTCLPAAGLAASAITEVLTATRETTR